jgi:hypothetical protein
MSTNEVPVLCNPAVLSPLQREQLESSTAHLLGRSQETRDLANGMQFRFPNQPRLLVEIAEFIGRESLCCPFLNFTLEVKPAGGPVWLDLTGPEGTKQFLQGELGRFLAAEAK